jgi:hypothetical protein
MDEAMKMKRRRDEWKIEEGERILTSSALQQWHNSHKVCINNNF